MNPIIKNILAVIGGWSGGSFVNMSLVEIGNKVFPIDGLDPNNLESYAAIFPSLSAKYFIFPFIAHALGTLVGGFVAAMIAAEHKMRYALIVGGVFLLGGLAVNYMISGPVWFTIVDILFAYIPMAWIGGMLAKSRANN